MIIIFISFAVLILFGILVVWKRMKDKKFLDLSPLAPNVLNLNPQYSNGHKFGFELSAKSGNDGEHLVNVLFNDYLPDSEGKTSEEIKPMSFVIGRGRRLSLGVGRFGSQKEGVIYLPSSWQKLDRNISESEFGRFIIDGMKRVEYENKVYEYLKKIESSTAKLIINLPDKAYALANAEILDSVQEALSVLTPQKSEENKKPNPFGGRM